MKPVEITALPSLTQGNSKIDSCCPSINNHMAFTLPTDCYLTAILSSSGPMSLIDKCEHLMLKELATEEEWVLLQKSNPLYHARNGAS